MSALSGKSEAVSVVIPCYNAAAFLRETLDSVFVQTHAPAEVTVQGTSAAPFLVDLFASWNLAGPATQLQWPDATGDESGGWWWDGTAYRFTPNLVPGRAYWLHTAQNITVNLGGR